MSHKENYQKWKEYQDLDASLKYALEIIDEKEIIESFYRDLEFGTGGMRGILGPGTNRMNIYVVRKATLGFGNYLKNEENALTRGIAISYDNRNMSKEFSLEAAKVLASLGFKVYLFRNLRPTPQLSFAVRHFNCIGGIMITASHNPKEYNGYKIYDRSGCQMLPDEADKVIEEISKITDYFQIENSKNSRNITYLEADFDKIYLERVKEIILNPNLGKDFKIVYTPLHGTGSTLVVPFLKSLGYNVIPVEKQMTEDKNFSGTESANPEDKKAFDEAIKLAKEQKAIIALATDPDADRVGAAVLHKGEFVLLNGNQTAAITMNYIAQTRNELQTLPVNGYVFASNVSSALPLAIAQSYNLKTETTLTGFKYIGDKIKSLSEKKGEFVFGYEESYGSLQKEFVRDKDAIQSVLILAEIASYTKSRNMTLIDYLEEIYQKYGYYLEETTNLAFKGIVGLDKMKEIMEFFRNNSITIPGFKLIKKEDFKKGISYMENKEEALDFPKADVIRYLFSDDSWFILRPSGTEPKLKIYFGVKALSMKDAGEKLITLKSQVEKLLKKE